MSGVLQGHIWSDGYSITLRACPAFFLYSVSQALPTTSSFVAPCFYKYWKMVFTTNNWSAEEQWNHIMLYFLSIVEEQVVMMYCTELFLYVYMVSQDALRTTRLNVIFNKCKETMKLFLCHCRLDDYRYSLQRLKHNLKKIWINNPIGCVS